MKWIIIIIFEAVFAFMNHVNSFRTAVHYCVFNVGWFINVQHVWRPRNQVSCSVVAVLRSTLIRTGLFPLTACQRVDPWCSLSCQITPILTAAFTTALPLPHRRRGFLSSALEESNQFLMFQKQQCSLEMPPGSICGATKNSHSRCSFI